MLISESHLRKIIREALSVRQFNDLVSQARLEVRDYIDNPDDSGNTFRKLLSAKLSKLGVPDLTDDEVRQLQGFIINLPVELIDDCSKIAGNPCKGVYSDGKIWIDKWHTMLAFSRSKLLNTIYHEFYHALDDAFDKVLDKKLDRIWSATHKETAKWNKSQAYRDLIERELEEFESQRKSVIGFDISELFSKELSSLRDRKVMNNTVAWAKKSLRLFPLGTTIGNVPLLIKLDNFTRDILNEPIHAYVAIHQLRRQFPGKSISQICNAPLVQREKLGYWEKVFLISFKCSGEADEAFKSIATHITRKESDTRVA